MTYESRVLAVLSTSRWMDQRTVFTRTRMAYYRCRSALGVLVDLGLVEHAKGRKIANVYRPGRRAYLYRKRQGV